MTGKVVLHHRHFLAHSVAIGQYRARPCGHALTFGGQTMEPLTASAQKNGHAEFKFELLDTAGKARLCDVATLRRAPEVSLFRHGDEVAKLPNKHQPQLANSGQAPRIS